MCRLLGGAVVQLDAHLLQISTMSVTLRDARDRGELVQHAVHAKRADGRALERREQHAPEGVAHRRAVTALERLAEELAVGRREALLVDLESFRLHELAPVAVQHGARRSDLTFLQLH
jgi:hypothetical protein